MPERDVPATTTRSGRTRRVQPSSVAGWVVGCIFMAGLAALVVFLAVSATTSLYDAVSLAGYGQAPACASHAPGSAGGCVHHVPATLRGTRTVSAGKGDSREAADLTTQAGRHVTVVMGVTVPDDDVDALAKLPAGTAITDLVYDGRDMAIQLPSGAVLASDQDQADQLIEGTVLAAFVVIPVMAAAYAAYARFRAKRGRPVGRVGHWVAFTVCELLVLAGVIGLNVATDGGVGLGGEITAAVLLALIYAGVVFMSVRYWNRGDGDAAPAAAAISTDAKP